jgi:hypothetical protein
MLIIGNSIDVVLPPGTGKWHWYGTGHGLVGSELLSKDYLRGA